MEAKTGAERQQKYRQRVKEGRVSPAKPPRPHSSYRDKHLYGVPYGFREEMAARQGYRCVICSRYLPEKGDLVMDHCHKTGQVRGLLCKWCNAGLGNFKDNPEFLKAAAEYLLG